MPSLCALSPNLKADAPCIQSPTDDTWMLIATVLVLGMLPGLAFFQAGLLRAKNSTSITVQVFSGTAVLSTMWILFGYSLALGSTADNSFIGGFDKALLIKVSYSDCFPGTNISSAVYALFQMMFAAITPLLMTGAFAERLAWKPFIFFMALWEFLVYYPVAHWLWSQHGWLNKLGAQDFAGGIVIHLTAGVGSLVSCIELGPRHDWNKHHGEAPYSSLPIASIGASMLWTGWFGFNGGSALAAGTLSIHAVMTSQVAATLCAFGFLLFALRRNGRASMLALINGAVAGLAGVTPAAGYISVPATIALAVLLCFSAQLAIWIIKHKLRIDDALEVSCVHGIPGVVGALYIGFAGDAEISGANGVVNGGHGKLLGAQCLACLVVGVWSIFWSYAILRVLKLFFNLRVELDAEKGGLDLHEHGEIAWLIDQLPDNGSIAIVPLNGSDAIDDLIEIPTGPPLADNDDRTVPPRLAASTRQSRKVVDDAIRQRAIVVLESTLLPEGQQAPSTSARPNSNIPTSPRGPHQQQPQRQSIASGGSEREHLVRSSLPPQQNETRQSRIVTIRLAPRSPTTINDGSIQNSEGPKK